MNVEDKKVLDLTLRGRTGCAGKEIVMTLLFLMATDLPAIRQQEEVLTGSCRCSA